MEQEALGQEKRDARGRWLPGQGGGGGKRKSVKRQCIRSLLKWSGEMKCPDHLCAKLRAMFGIHGNKTLTVDEATILVVRYEGLKGKSWAVEFWGDRTEGKAVQPIDLENMPPLFTVGAPPPIETEAREVPGEETEQAKGDDE